MFCFQASGAICRRYDERCKKLRHQESRGGNQIDIDFTRASVKDLHSRVLVAVHKIGFISKKIQDVRDKYLQPQLDELIGWYVSVCIIVYRCMQKDAVPVHYNMTYRCVSRHNKICFTLS